MYQDIYMISYIYFSDMFYNHADQRMRETIVACRAWSHEKTANEITNVLHKFGGPWMLGDPF
jgi:hypothetical protein